jgi:hemerythrin-like domain-containing protein
MKSTDLLIQEHKLILRALDVLDAMASLIADNRSVEQPDVSKILDFLRWFGDAHHQAKEETILFPALKEAASAQERPIEHMHHEHEQERSFVERLESDLRLAKFSNAVAIANQMSSTLRNHIYKEDRILFETVDAALSPEEDAAVFERLTAFETDADKETLQAKLHDLHALEWKYLRR